METTTQSRQSVSNRACGKCQFWQPVRDNEGECRRHAPRSVAFNVDDRTRYEAHFPETTAADWCGEFEPR